MALAEALQIPVATSLNGKDSIPGKHPLSVGVVGTYSRESANRVVNRADLVCFIGSETGGMTTHFWAVPPIGTPAIQIDIDPEALGRNYPLQAGVNGDAKIALARMSSTPTAPAPAGARPGSPRRRRSARSGRRSTRRRSAPTRCRSGRSGSARELTRHVPDDAIVVVDTGHAGMWMGGIYDLASPRQSYMRSAGHLGWAFPAGLGAKCACPDRPVVTFTGDAGFWYHIAEIETAVRWKHQRGDGRQQQRRRQPVQARLRPRLRRRADRAGARAVDLQQGELRPHRRGHGRARHPRGEARAISPAPSSARSRRTGPS